MLFSIKLRWSHSETPPPWPWRSPASQDLSPSWPSLQQKTSPSQRNLEARSSSWTSSDSGSNPPMPKTPKIMVPSPSISVFQPSHQIWQPPSDMGILEGRAGAGRRSLAPGGEAGAGRRSSGTEGGAGAGRRSLVAGGGAGAGPGDGASGYLPPTWRHCTSSSHPNLVVWLH